MLKQDSPRHLLAELRGGDFAHPGDTEAIDMVMGKLLEHMSFSKTHGDPTEVKVLDAGCGLAGTADYVRMQTSFDVYGIDIDIDCITHGKVFHPGVKLFQCDIKKVPEKFGKDAFDIIYLFNSFNGLPKQSESLKFLAAVAKPDAVLAIFDYVRDKNQVLYPTDVSGKASHPIIMEDITLWLKDANWELLEMVDLRLKYLEWYEKFLLKLQSNHDKLLDKYSRNLIMMVENSFIDIIENIQKRIISGGVVYAKINGNNK